MTKTIETIRAEGFAVTSIDVEVIRAEAERVAAAYAEAGSVLGDDDVSVAAAARMIVDAIAPSGRLRLDEDERLMMRDRLREATAIAVDLFVAAMVRMQDSEAERIERRASLRAAADEG